MAPKHIGISDDEKTWKTVYSDTAPSTTTPTTSTGTTTTTTPAPQPTTKPWPAVTGREIVLTPQNYTTKLTRVGDGTHKLVRDEVLGHDVIECTGDQVRFTTPCTYHNFWVEADIRIVRAVNNYPAQFYGRDGGGWNHSTDPVLTCLGCCYKGRPQDGGKFEIVKELNHPAYCGNVGDLPSVMPKFTDSKFHKIGFLVADQSWDAVKKCYPVLLQGWMDGVKYGEYLDNGAWFCTDGDFSGSCARRQFGQDKKILPGNRQRNEILNGAGTHFVIRSDGMDVWRLDKLVIKEVAESP